MPKKLTQSEILRRFTSVHGNKYDYRKVAYVLMHYKVAIVCPMHGEFWQRPSDHINLRQGCPKCGGHGFSDEERFWKFVKKSDGCWTWKGYVRSNGYGYHKLFGEGKESRVAAHRFAYVLHHGSIQSEMLVCHNCDNPTCVRPDHLFLGTAQDNTDDMMQKGRANPRRGEKAGQSKLTQADVDEIRRRSFDGMLGKRLASEFHISTGQVSRIINRKEW